MIPNATWTPRLERFSGARYLAIVDALAADISTGAVQPGTQLPPQRDMAEQLGWSVGTVAKAYAEASRRGLISGEVGRGTFVEPVEDWRDQTGSPRRSTLHQPVDMTLNAPPRAGEDELVAAAMARVAGQGLGGMTGYLPHAGMPAHRAAVAGWLANGFRLPVSSDQVLLCNGAQHGIAIAFMATVPVGAPILAEQATYPGLLGLCQMLGHKLHGVGMDGEGLLPDALSSAFERTGARHLYCMPTLQTPTGATMTEARRQAVAAVLRQWDAVAVEDDVYGFLTPDGPPPLACYAPDQVCYASSFSKCATPGLRLGALVMPERFRDRATAALRATGWMASPLLAACATDMIREGAMASLMAIRLDAAARRWELAIDILQSVVPNLPQTRPAFHMWVPLRRPVVEVIAEAAMQGVVLAPAAQVPGAEPLAGLRLCLGAPSDMDELQWALHRVAGVLGGRESRSLL